jgi:hypothetical protein
LADTAITRWSTRVVWKVGMLMNFSISGVMLPAAPNTFNGTQPPVVTEQLVLLKARRACCTLVREKPLPVVSVWSARPLW